jgi:hypothetical protein
VHQRPTLVPVSETISFVETRPLTVSTKGRRRRSLSSLSPLVLRDPPAGACALYRRKRRKKAQRRKRANASQIGSQQRNHQFKATDSGVVERAAGEEWTAGAGAACWSQPYPPGGQAAAETLFLPIFSFVLSSNRPRTASVRTVENRQRAGPEHIFEAASWYKYCTLLRAVRTFWEGERTKNAVASAASGAGMRYSEIQREAPDSSCNDAMPFSSLGRTVGASMRTAVKSWCNRGGGGDDSQASYSCSGVRRQTTTMSRVPAAASDLCVCLAPWRIGHLYTGPIPAPAGSEPPWSVRGDRARTEQNRTRGEARKGGDGGRYGLDDATTTPSSSTSSFRGWAGGG